MANPNGRKGSKWETDLLKFFRSIGLWIERLTKAGANDEGDLVTIVSGKTYIFELKNVKKIDLPKFWEEAKVEAKNYAKARNLEVVPPAFVIIKRRNHGVNKAWVIQDLEQWLEERQ